MRFEWDERKNASNVRKQGIDFDVAREVFSDPLAVDAQDRFVSSEERLKITGLGGGHLLVVAFVVRDFGEGVEYVRIISARRADRQERRDYERGA